MSIRILLAIVSRAEGNISPFTALNLATLGGAHDLTLTIMPSPHDIVRTRSRMAAIALEGDYSHLLFWDADVSTRDPVAVIRQMVAAEVDVICTPYPKKSEKLHAWRDAPSLADARAAIYDWPVVTIDHPHNDCNGAREVGLVPMGCTLISRTCLEKMSEDAPPFLDSFGGVKRRVPATFALRHIGEQMFSEDHSFCYRWRELGGSVWLNMASVCDHFGMHLFAGDP